MNSYNNEFHTNSTPDPHLPATLRVHVDNIYCPLKRLDSLHNTMLKIVNTEFKYLLN